MLFPEAIDVHPGVGAALGSAVTGLFAWLIARLRTKRGERADAVSEWVKIHERDEDKIQLLEEAVAKLQREHYDCQTQCTELQRKIGDLTGKLAAIEARMNGQYPNH